MSKWKEKEKLVAFIESQIDSSARVEHDVNLPDLSGSSESRQCDVIIRTGRPPRETISLVEVQDRSAPFNITFFDGLINKMQKVGAQHLICVSNIAFPASIVNEAKKHGNTIRLVVFEEDIAFGEYIVPQFFNNAIQVNDRNIISISNASLGFQKGEMPDPQYNKLNNSSEELFHLDGEKINISKFILKYIDLIGIELSEGKSTISIDSSKINKDLYFHIPELEKDFKIKILMDVEIERKLTWIPFFYSSYKQYNVDDPLAIILEAKGNYKNQEVIFQYVLTPLENGMYKMDQYRFPEIFKEYNLNLIEMRDA